ncbi:DUF6907 domain-containing protein [Streptomyces sp. 1331.2]|uniref:DUF6907 domain-containing protein n=1 Tax=Streptomyces sp. 1331.2 TaxID=1938835 RepID=UPI000BD8D8D1|nr:hypothetical protein [Streptomyces sp. 1331.2]SOB84219.1 hypothetical protein SAMN06272789_4464 [Streptomyces sp. 1331.2]
MTTPRTATVHTWDQGMVTVPCPPWCLGTHEDGLDLVDLAHEGPETALTLVTHRGPVRLLDAALCQYPYSSNLDDRGVKLSVLLGLDGWHRLAPADVYALAETLTARAVELRALARQLAELQSGGTR